MKIFKTLSLDKSFRIYKNLNTSMGINISKYKNPNDVIIPLFCKVANPKFIKIENKCAVFEIDKRAIENLVTDLKLPKKNPFSEIVEDERFAYLAYQNILFYKDKTKNYIPSKNLVNAISSLDLKKIYAKDLKKCCLYFEFQDIEYKLFDDVIQSISIESHSDFLLAVARFSNKGIYSVLIVHEDERCKGNLLDLEFISIENKNQSSFVRLIFNLLIYVTNPNEEFNEHFNKFSTNKRIADVQKKSGTEKKFIEIGKNFEMLRITRVNEVLVSGFWRHQACGKDHLERKYIFVKPFIRSIENTVSCQ